ncbi:MAG: hypothetical protein ABSF84_02250 [Acidimicrobiales bacterium]|jgi:hypothetical protein
MEHHQVCRKSTDDRGLSMVVMAASLLVTAVLVLFAIKATGTTGSSGAGPPSDTPSGAVSTADATEAQQNLATGLTSAEQSGASGQAVDPATLQESNPSIDFTSGPSTGPGAVSVASTTAGSAVALTARAADGTCWVVWWSPTGGTWYGAQTGQSSCTAPSPSTIPAAGPVSSSSIGWQQGSYPSP